MSTAAQGKVVLIHFKLTDVQSGEVLEDSTDRAPMPVLFGTGSIMPGLETEITGKKQGDRFDLTLSAEQAYGPHNGEEPTAYPRNMFPPEAQIVEGMSFQVTDNKGVEAAVYVTKIDGDVIHLDQNHPLAGRSLRFEGSVAGVRDATDEEVQHGHPHGPDGHGHH